MVFVSEQWLLVSILSLLIAAFIYVEKQRGGKSLSLHEVTRLVNSGEAVLVDLREAKDFSAGHIVDAINIPYNKMAERSIELDKYKDKTVIVLDKMGQHTGAAVKTLTEKEFTVMKMQGGMTEWLNQNLPVVKS